MRKMKFYFFLLLCCGIIQTGWATPTSLFWTNCITDVQPAGTGHFGVDNYFTVFNRRGHGQFFNPDIGCEVGLFTWHDISCEIGIDYLGGADDPLLFNGKIGMQEDKLFKHAPSWSLGIFDVGTRANVTNWNIVDFIIGHSLPNFIGGHLYIGGYAGNKSMGRVRQGFMVGFNHTFCPAKDCCGKDYNKWAIAADYASGKNAIGGGGFAVVYYFSPVVSVETGPVWFNDRKINGRWKWSIQIDIDVSLFEVCNNSN